MDVSKISIGFETLGIDVQVQMQAYADPALPWPPVNRSEMVRSSSQPPAAKWGCILFGMPLI